MGYYDSHYQKSERSEQKGAKRSIVYSFFSAILGGLIVVFFIPTLANNGHLPYDVVPKDTNQRLVEKMRKKYLAVHRLRL